MRSEKALQPARRVMMVDSPSSGDLIRSRGTLAVGIALEMESRHGAFAI